MPDGKKKILNAGNLFWFLRAIAIIVGVTATTVATLLVFYFQMEKDQDTSIAETTKHLTETTTILTEHVKQADKTFEGINRNMLEQRTINEKTNDALNASLVWSSILRSFQRIVAIALHIKISPRYLNRKESGGIRSGNHQKIVRPPVCHRLHGLCRERRHGPHVASLVRYCVSP